MAKRRVMFTFPPKLITQPIIYLLAHNFKLITNIRRADVTENRGWVVLELEGDNTEIDKGIAWAVAQGVRVDPVIGDVVEG